MSDDRNTIAFTTVDDKHSITIFDHKSSLQAAITTTKNS